MEKNIKKNVYVYMYVCIHFAVQQKLTQHFNFEEVK